MRVVNIPVSEVNNAWINGYVQSRYRAGMGEIATNRALTILKATLNRASKVWGVPIQPIDWQSFKTAEKKRTRHLSRSEADALVSELPEHAAQVVRWALATGCRRAECVNLKWRDVLFEKGIAVVTAKGDKEHKVMLTDAALSILAERPMGRPSDPVFDATNLRKLWDAAIVKTGLEGVTFHVLRHTHATWLRQAGAPLEIVQRSLGHTTLTMTQRYAHVDDQETHEWLEKATHRATPSSHTNSNVVRISAKQSGA